MTWLTTWLLEHATDLLTGGSVLLILGAGATLASRSPIYRQRLGEWTVAAVVLWFAFAVVPLPRWSMPGRLPVESLESTPGVAAQAAASTQPATQPAILPAKRPATLPRQRGPGPGGGVAAPVAKFTAGDPDTAASGSIAWSELAVGSFLLGSATSLLWLLVGFGFLWVTIARRRSPPAWVDVLVDELCAATGSTKRPHLHLIRRGSPFCFELIRQHIALPAHICVVGHENQVRQVVLHELAHLRQRDGRGRLLFAAALPLLWFHPLYWWIRARTHLACEMLADDRASQWSDKGSYARQLIRLAETPEGWRLVPRPLTAGAVFTKQTQFYRRMKMLMERKNRLTTRCSRRSSLLQALVAVLVVAAAATTWGANTATAQGREHGRHEGRTQDRPPGSGPAKTRRELVAEIEYLRQRLQRLGAASQPGLDPDPAGTTISVVVAKGDTLASIVKKHYGTARPLPRVIEFNRKRDEGFDARRLRVGQRIVLPWRSSPGSIVGFGFPAGLSQPGQTPGMTQPSTSPLGSPRSLPSSSAGVTSLGQPSDPAPISGSTPASESASTPAEPQVATAPARIDHSADVYILDLISRSIDLEGDIEEARHEMDAAARSMALAKAGAVDSLTASTAMAKAKIKTRRSERQRELVQSLIRAEILATKVELKRALGSKTRGRASKSEIVRLESRIQILESAK